MITIYTSSNPESLVKSLAKSLKDNHSSVFQPVHLVSSGYQQELWLKEALAKENGIIANLKTYKSDRLLSWLLFILNGNKADEVFSLQDLEWFYFSIMGSGEFRTKFPELDQYFGTDQVKRFALAQKAVRLLDKYEEFRDDLVDTWRHTNSLDTTDWQEFLFVKALKDYGDFVPDKSLLPTRVRDLLRKEEHLSILKKQLPTLYIFGNFSLSPKFLEFLEVLQAAIDICWFRLDFVTTRTLHSTAKNWAESATKANQAIAEAFGSKCFQALETTSSCPALNTVLSKVQHTLLTNKELKLNQEELKGDQSLEFHSCHTRVREVETLYNYLIRLLGDSPEIGARDIQVFVPQLEPYISAIRTIFDTAPVTLPYRIISRGYSREEGFWSALIQLIQLNKAQFNAVQLMELVESKAIRDFFGFEDFEMIRKMMSEANMARDYEGDTENETRFYALEYGLKRLVYGYLLGKQDYVFHDGEEEVFTCNSVEGKQANDLFRLLDLVQKLEKVLREKEEPKTLKAWLEWVNKLAAEFLETDPLTDKQFQNLLIQSASVAVLVEEEIQFETFAFRFIHLLEEQDSHTVAGFGGIIFSEILPGRVLPKKVIAMVGMNFGDFPRTARVPSFDKLLSGESRPLDPNPRISDQGTFLEVVLGAEKALYLSFIGKSDQDNKSIPAATVVEELMDMVATASGLKSEKFVVTHPLHAISIRYNQPHSPKLKNYLIQPESKLTFQPADGQPLPQNTEVKLSQLKSFLKDPFKYFYNEVLGIYYGEKRDQLLITEVFDSDSLNDWIIKDLLLHADLQEEEILRKELLAKGLLPLRNVGREVLERASLEVAEVKEAYQRLLPVTLVHTKLEIKDIQLTGQLKVTSNSKLVFATVSKKKKKYQMDAALEYLLGVATGISSELIFLSVDSQEEWVRKVSQEEAIKKLTQLVEIFAKHRATRFIYSSEIDLKKTLAMNHEDQLSSARSKVQETCTSDYKFPGEYLKRDYELNLFGADKVIEELIQNYKTITEIFSPIID